jgi:HNH endonuclease
VARSTKHATAYQSPRPPIPGEIRRAVEVESGHSCAITRCNEHTYLEVHHINGNREDNRVENLILLCDKHHKMAGRGVIDRKAVLEYKKLLKSNHTEQLVKRLNRLERLMEQAPKIENEPEQKAQPVDDPDLPVKSVASRPYVMAQVIEQLAIAKFERLNHVFLERDPRFSKDSVRLELDALRQDFSLPEDLIVEVRWLRKRYLDSPLWIQQMDAKSSLYELITGRKARGVLILVVPEESMRQLSLLPATAGALGQSERKPEVIIYSYDDLGFDPGPVSAGLFPSNSGSPR